MWFLFSPLSLELSSIAHLLFMFTIFCEILCEKKENDFFSRSQIVCVCVFIFTGAKQNCYIFRFEYSTMWKKIGLLWMLAHGVFLVSKIFAGSCDFIIVVVLRVTVKYAIVCRLFFVSCCWCWYCFLSLFYFVPSFVLSISLFCLCVQTIGSYVYQILQAFWVATNDSTFDYIDINMYTNTNVVSSGDFCVFSLFFL